MTEKNQNQKRHAFYSANLMTHTETVSTNLLLKMPK